MDLSFNPTHRVIGNPDGYHAFNVGDEVERTDVYEGRAIYVSRDSLHQAIRDEDIEPVAMNPDDIFDEINRQLAKLNGHFDSSWVAQQIANVEGELYELRKIVNTK